MFISCGLIHYLVCCSGPLETLMIFTNTIMASNIYIVLVLLLQFLIWLYITVVVVVISFSIIVSCIFIVKKFPAIYRTLTVTSMYTRARHSSVPTPPQPVSF